MVKGYPSRIPAIPWRIPARDSGYPPGDSDLGRGCIAQAAAAAPPVAIVGGQYASCIGRRHPSPTYLPLRPTSPRLLIPPGPIQSNPSTDLASALAFRSVRLGTTTSAHTTPPPRS
ncbi:hypothetical protein PGTUg99_020766 [Puccinia graminis f. sp. tritici]|uniref:Uncharacterized protein n=1 Tax=Puccinia graminis f. sp. tritici TaxID=56615 RepID=A0A5B0PRG1_PUCGR|nr:hypothetical protein PGTUg99_020766 [Puccinia graminis f. sp. tritici]